MSKPGSARLRPLRHLPVHGAPATGLVYGVGVSVHGLLAYPCSCKEEGTLGKEVPPSLYPLHLSTSRAPRLPPAQPWSANARPWIWESQDGRWRSHPFLGWALVPCANKLPRGLGEGGGVECIHFPCVHPPVARRFRSLSVQARKYTAGRLTDLRSGPTRHRGTGPVVLSRSGGHAMPTVSQ